MALESSAEHPQPLRVVIDALKGWVERTGPIWVEGQIIQLKRRHGASIHFLTLRDLSADVSVQVTVTTAVLDAAGPVTEGTQVTAWVKAQIYPANGSLTFACRELRPTGEGRLLAHLEQRKRVLQAEGLFAPELKKRLPFVPRLIGLITGKDSAAERDVLVQTQHRWPAAQFVVRHVLVQGPQAAEQSITALGELDEIPEVDVIIVARGGGSVEDLLPFSDEALIRAVFACQTPVVSAIGHETDTPILDLVADVRASTPTAAAKLVVPDAVEESAIIAHGLERLRQAIIRKVEDEHRWLAELRSRPVLRDPSGPIVLQATHLADLTARMRQAVSVGLERETAILEQTLARVRALSPQATLQRGYAILSSDDGRTLSSINQVEPDDIVVARVLDGDIAAAVIDVEPHSPFQEES